MPLTSARTVLVPPERLDRWFENFAGRHGTVEYAAGSGSLLCRAADGALAEAVLPLGQVYGGPPTPDAFAAAAVVDLCWGILLVRKGGFAVATLAGSAMSASKVGQRHVQGRTKAGGQSQQRFARRRDNQARQAYEAAAEHAHRLLVAESPPLDALICGGDRPAVDAVLTDPRLARVAARRTDPWLPVPDPRRAVLVQAAIDGRSVTVHLTDPSS